MGDIEAVLSQCSGIQATGVVCREDLPGDKELVASVVPGSEARDVPELRAYLQTRLPEYMVPSSLVVLKQLPLTANGKMDKWALPASDAADRKPGTAYVAPTSEAQQRMVQLLPEVLILNQVDFQDDFPALGGHSLLLLRVHNELQREFGQPLSVLASTQLLTIETLAVFLDPEKRKSNVFNAENREEPKEILRWKTATHPFRPRLADRQRSIARISDVILGHRLG